MRRWVWSVLLIAAAVLALTGSALAAPVTLDSGLVVDGTSVVGYTGNGGRVVIPSNITEIRQDAFAGNRKITEVIIPKGVISIGPRAFKTCSGLKTVVFLEGAPNQSVSIGSEAFLGCSNLSDLVLSPNVTSIQEQAFAGSGLTKLIIPDGSQKLTISKKAFYMCDKLSVLYLPERFDPSGIQAEAFDGTAASLKEIHAANVGADFYKYFVNQKLPDGKTSQNVHQADHLRIPSEPDCTSDGGIKDILTCGFKASPCTNLGQIISLSELGHDAPDPAMPGGHHPCESWTWEYDVTCSRCGNVDHRKKEIAATKDHEWQDGAVTHLKLPTCKEEGQDSIAQTCKVCNQDGPPKVVTVPKRTAHTYTDKTSEYVIRPPLCSYKGLTVYYKVCDVCGQTNACEECERLKVLLEAAQKKYEDKQIVYDSLIAEGQQLEAHLAAEHGGDPASPAYVKIVETDMTSHTKPEGTLPDPDKSEAPTCEKGGKNVYDYKCAVCGQDIKDEEEPLGALGHDDVYLNEGDKDSFQKAPTCTEGGIKLIGAQKCTRCGRVIQERTETVPALGHQWGSPVPNEGEEDGYVPATCTQDGKIKGTVTCTREGCGVTQTGDLTLPALGHDWGEWTTAKAPTATESGTQERTCKREGCGQKETRTLPPLDVPVDPGDPDTPGKPGDPGTTPEDKTYKIDVVQASNGTTTVSRSTAKKGDSVVITVSPSSGYVLDMIRVISDSQSIGVTDLGGGQYRFIMPAADVQVRVTYDRTGSNYAEDWSTGFGNTGNGSRTDPRRTSDSLPVQIQEPGTPKAAADQRMYRDVPLDHWAAGEINWASNMGYMSGSAGQFDPDGLISHQQMWMVLARLTGSNPTSMNEARRWAELGGYADGSSPTGPVKRHQLVTALYRCARLTGRASRVTTSLSGYPDSRTVPAVAREAFTWALSCGVISSDAEGRLKPNETLTRAQFAAILYCYSQRV